METKFETQEKQEGNLVKIGEKKTGKEVDGKLAGKYTLQLFATQPRIAPSGRQIVRSRGALLGVLPQSWMLS